MKKMINVVIFPTKEPKAGEGEAEIDRRGVYRLNSWWLMTRATGGDGLISGPGGAITLHKVKLHFGGPNFISLIRR